MRLFLLIQFLWVFSMVAIEFQNPSTSNGNQIYNKKSTTKQNNNNIKRDKIEILTKKYSIGSVNDDEMKNFKPISAHGREDIMNQDGEDLNTYLYQLKIFFRIIIHAINFSPVLFTFFFALISTDFRNYVWYPLLRNALGRSGAVSIHETF